MQRYSSVTLHFSSINPISEVKNKVTSAKFQILSCYFFPEWLGHKTLEHWFFNDFQKKSAQTDVGFDLERAQTSEHCY